MPSHLKTQLEFDATPARIVYRRASNSDHNTCQQSTMDLDRLQTIRRSAESKLRLESQRQDRDLRHILGHVAVLDQVDDEELRNCQRPSVVSPKLPRSESQSRLNPFDELTSPGIEVGATEVSEDDSDSDSSIDDEDGAEFDFWDDDEHDSEHTLVRVQSHPPMYAHIPISPSERKPQLFSNYAPA